MSVFRNDRRLRQLIVPIKMHWLMGTSAMAMGGVLLTLDPMVTRVIIDQVLSRRQLQLLPVLIDAIVAFALIGAIFDRIGTYLVTSCLEQIRARMQRGMVKSQLGDFDTGGASRLLTMVPARAVRAALQVGVICAMMALLNLWAGLAALLAVVVLGFGTMRALNRIASANLNLKKATGVVTDRLARISASRGLVESLSGLRGVQANAHAAADRVFAWKAIFGLQRTAWSQALNAVVIIGTGLAVLNGTLTIGGFVAIAIYFWRIQQPLLKLVSCYKEAVEHRPNLIQVLDHLERGDAAKNTGPMPETAWGGRIEVVGIKIARGERILFTGPEAASGQAVLELLQGVAAPEAGSLTIGGYPLSEMPELLRKKWAAVVAANPRFWPGSVRENLCPRTSVGLSRFHQIIEATGLRPLVEGGGLEQRLDPRALTQLEKQRLQVARVLVQNPEVILVEDFIGVLAGEDVNPLFAALNKFGKTIVAAGRRERFLELVDKVVWIENGKCDEPVDVDRFLRSKHASSLIPQGHLLAAVQGTGALLHASQWAGRNGIQLESFSIELFGDMKRALSEIDGVALTVRESVREADLVLFAGKSRLRCIFFGGVRGLENGELEERLIRSVAQYLDDRQAQGVHFSVVQEGKIAA